MKKLILFFFATILSFGVAIANTLTEQEPVVPCSASECPGSGVLCCKDAKTGDPFYKRA